MITEFFYNIINYFKTLNTEDLIQLVKAGGPIIGIILPVIEAFIPILPLVLFVTINVNVFGVVLGYLYSWIGNCLGSFLLFFILKKIGGKKIEEKISKSKYSGALNKIKSRNSSILFLFYCFPFTPSFLISGASALSNMSIKDFLTSLIPGKFIMLISLALIGMNIGAFFEKPLRSVLFLIMILLINYAIKHIAERSSLFIVNRKKDK
jgi:uncharacterized membrane protein YdjX (TVP38/TMEM64 family)